MLDPQKTPHTSPQQVSYGVSFVNICKRIDHAIMVSHCIISKLIIQNSSTGTEGEIVLKMIRWMPQNLT